jgi:ADP-ribosylglycohydrolase
MYGYVEVISLCSYLKFEFIVQLQSTEQNKYTTRIRNLPIRIIFTVPVMQYTDDAAMTKCLAESLITEEKFDAVDVAKR